MEFNSDKFDLLRYRCSASKELQSETSYLSNDGSTIEEQEQVCDLGVTMSSDATFTNHIMDRCELVKSKISWVLRTFQSRHCLPMLTLWKTLIRCHLEYCSQLWSPNTIGATQSLELLQRAFVSRIDGMHGLSYWEQLCKLKLFSLERSR